ncbi:2-polyprenyl-6-methoxyphenol hydroxylase [Bacillus sp. JCM 19045]|nr:2-polyprenyl-6-methoxyphenol hydroxylase [Bacillus sp. JCM 19045]
MKTEVLIIGGGVAGLTLALKLVKRKIDVVIVEKDPTLGRTYKGELIQPKTIQLLDRLGLLQLFQEQWNTFSTIHTTELSKENTPILNQAMSYQLLPGPYNYATMLPHSQIKKLLLQELLTYESFTNLQPAVFSEIKKDNEAVIRIGKEKVEIQARFIIGAEGVGSKVRKHMGVSVSKQTYNHDFLTVSFPAPKELKAGEMVATHDRFLGLFPLPNQEVRTVYLIRKGEFKKWRSEPLQQFYDHYISLYPPLDGYVQHIQAWKDIQLMVPIRQHTDRYVKDSFVLIGDAAHSVHPMAGEGMNLAIQGADVLGELLGDMYETGNQDQVKWLEEYENVRKKRVKSIMDLSHMGGVVYGKSGVAWQRSRALA